MDKNMNLVANPAAFGMREVATLDASQSCEFDLLVALQDVKTKEFFILQDTGNYCGIDPWEFLDTQEAWGPQSVDEVRAHCDGPMSRGDAKTLMRDWAGSSERDDFGIAQCEVERIIATVK